MSRKYAYLCGVPDSECQGADGLVFGLVGPPKTRKLHGSRQEAMSCYKKWLKKQGYTQIGPRDFRPPDGSEVLVLNTESTFGGLVREGKEGRWMYDIKKGYIY